MHSQKVGKSNTRGSGENECWSDVTLEMKDRVSDGQEMEETVGEKSLQNTPCGKMNRFVIWNRMNLCPLTSIRWVSNPL
jgi:hypothetical protein